MEKAWEKPSQALPQPESVCVHAHSRSHVNMSVSAHTVRGTVTVKVLPTLAG